MGNIQDFVKYRINEDLRAFRIKHLRLFTADDEFAKDAFRMFQFYWRKFALERIDNFIQRTRPKKKQKTPAKKQRLEVLSDEE